MDRLSRVILTVSRSMLVPLLWVLVMALALAIVLSRRAAGRLRDDIGRHLSVGADGIIVGAAGIDLRHARSEHGVLLLHGGGDTPQTLRYLAEHLHARGYNVRAPLLPGHGRTLREFSSVTADAWLEAARKAHSDLLSENGWVGIAGLSMGGALAVRLAADDGAIPAIALLAPYLAMPAKIAMAARFSTIWGIAVPLVRALDPSGPRSIHDPVEMERSLAYGAFTPAALRALHTTVRRAMEALPRVAVPTLMIQSREDNRIEPEIAQRAFDQIGARDKKLVWTSGAGHVITVDYGRERVFELVGDWFDRHRALVQQDRPA
jgi:carboxylesterase